MSSYVCGAGGGATTTTVEVSVAPPAAAESTTPDVLAPSLASGLAGVPATRPTDRVPSAQSTVYVIAWDEVTSAAKFVLDGTEYEVNALACEQHNGLVSVSRPDGSTMVLRVQEWERRPARPVILQVQPASALDAQLAAAPATVANPKCWQRHRRCTDVAGTATQVATPDPLAASVFLNDALVARLGRLPKTGNTCEMTVGQRILCLRRAHGAPLLWEYNGTMVTTINDLLAAVWEEANTAGRRAKAAQMRACLHGE